MPPPCRPGARPARPSNMIGMRPAITSLSDHRRARGVHERDIRLGAVAEQFAGQMRLAAAVGGAEQHAARRLVGERDQFRDVADRHVLVDGDRDRLLADHADRHERRLQVDRHLAFLLDRQHGVGRGLRHVEGVAVLLDAGRGLRRDQPAGAGPVEDDDLLLPDLRQAVGDDARATSGLLPAAAGVMNVTGLVG